MENCVFCKIVNGDIPCEKVYESDKFLAFMDIHPRGKGHVQVIPKIHYRWVWDVPEAGEYFEIVRKIALAQKKAFDVEMVRSQIFGDEVPHAHIWLWTNEDEGKENLKENAKKIIAAF